MPYVSSCSLSDIPSRDMPLNPHLRGCLGLEPFVGVKMCVMYRVTIEINVWFLVTSTACFC